MSGPAAVAAAKTAEDAPELSLPAGLPGFPKAQRFILVPWGAENSPFSLLRSLDDSDLEFVVVPPGVFFPGYAPELDDDIAESLGLSDPDDAVVLVLVTVGDVAAEATANLLAPIVVNRHTREAAQVVLADDLELQAPLFA